MRVLARVPFIVLFFIAFPSAFGLAAVRTEEGRDGASMSQTSKPKPDADTTGKVGAEVTACESTLGGAKSTRTTTATVVERLTGFTRLDAVAADELKRFADDFKKETFEAIFKKLAAHKTKLNELNVSLDKFDPDAAETKALRSQIAGQIQKVEEEADALCKLLGMFRKISENYVLRLKGQVAVVASVSDKDKDKPGFGASLAAAFAASATFRSVSPGVVKSWNEGILPTLRGVVKILNDNYLGDGKLLPASVKPDEFAQINSDVIASLTREVDKFIGNQSSLGTSIGFLQNLSTQIFEIAQTATPLARAVNSENAAGARDLLGELVEITGRGDEVVLTAGEFTTGYPALKQSLDAIKEQVKQARRAYSLLDQAFAGDASKFVNEEVKLYFFRDVPRIMRMINPETSEFGVRADLRKVLAEKRAQLDAADLARSTAQDEVNRLGTMLQRLREEKRQLTARLENLTKLATAAKRRADRTANLPETDSRRIRANERKEDIDAERESARQREAELNNEQTGLPKKIADAEAALLEAQRAVKAKAGEALLLARAESDAFAAARENENFLLAPPNILSSDPIRRVQIQGLPDKMILILRGNRRDVKKVQAFIDLLDQPTPQARMTLWNIEINDVISDSQRGFFSSKRSDGERALRAINIVEAELANTRARINAATSLFRDCVNEVANERARNLLQLRYGRSPAHFEQVDEDQLARARRSFFHPEVLMRFGLCSTISDCQQGTYLNFVPGPPPPVLPTLPPPPSTFEIERLFDPAATTTLGSALTALILADVPTRTLVFERFENRLRQLNGSIPVTLPERLRSGNEKDYPPGIPRENNPARSGELELFPSLRRAFGLSMPPQSTQSPPPSPNPYFSNTSAQLTPNQYSILSALGLMYEREEREVRGLQSGLAKVSQDIQLIVRNAKCGPPGTRCEPSPHARLLFTTQDYLALCRAFNEAFAIIENIQNKMKARGHCPDCKVLDCADLKLLFGPSEPPPNFNADFGGVYQRFLGTQQSLDLMIDNRYPMSRRNPFTVKQQVALLDEMMKGYYAAMEDDIDRHFIQPMVLRLRKDLIKTTSFGFTNIQRTSVLASNRSLARVDATASAQLPVGQEIDLVQSTQQLLDLVLNAKTAGLAGLIGTANAQPRDDKSELYGLTTTGTFKVTPVFEPGGQSLRFQFDQVYNTQVRDPNGSTNPQTPRIERHTINTEVQLSNLELREISRFNSNYRLGIPEKKWGGIPILNQLPYIENIPLLGWFYRKRGQAAGVQQSIVFAQTAMYPSVEEYFKIIGTRASSQYDENQDEGLPLDYQGESGLGGYFNTYSPAKAFGQSATTVPPSDDDDRKEKEDSSPPKPRVNSTKPISESVDQRRTTNVFSLVTVVRQAPTLVEKGRGKKSMKHRRKKVVKPLAKKGNGKSS